MKRKGELMKLKRTINGVTFNRSNYRPVITRFYNVLFSDFLVPLSIFVAYVYILVYDVSTAYRGGY